MRKVIVGINSKYIHPAVGAHQIKANFDGELDLIEVNIKDDMATLASKLTKYDLIAFSAYIWNIEYIKDILSTSLLEKTVILGGPEASYRFDILFTYPQVKYIIKGEGEESFPELMNYLDGKMELDKVSNIYYKDDDGNIKYTYTKLPDLTKIKHDYTINSDFKNKICYIESSRGCYFSCTYCLASTEKPVREFPIEEVKSNLKYLLDNNAKIIKFLDRSFNINQKRTLNILQFIKDNDNNFTTFQFEVVGDMLSSEIIDLLKTMRKKSIRFEIGIQSTNPKTMEAIKRKQDFSKIRNNVLALRDFVVIHTDLICGLPYEDLTSFKKSFNETFMLLTEELQLGFLKELKGTEISDTKDLYGYNFETQSPYEVLSNNYITLDELNEVKLVEEALDKLYNYCKYQKTFSYLFNELKLDPYDTFLSISKYFKANSSLKAQLQDVSKNLYLSLYDKVSDREKLLYLIKQDYLINSKIKPAIWWSQEITRKERLYIYQKVSTLYNLSIDTLFNYARCEKYNNEYFIIIYPKKDVYYYTSLLAPCGFDCSFCPEYNKECSGCLSDNLHKFCHLCEIRNCVKETKITCYNCNRYPCEKLDNISTKSRETLDFLRK